MEKYKRKGSIALYGIIGIFLTSISVLVMNSSFEMINNAKENYMTEAKLFTTSEINKILTNCKNEGSGTHFTYSYSLPFNYGENIAISATCDRDALYPTITTAKFKLIGCYKVFPNAQDTICKDYRGTGDLSKSWL